MTRMAMLVDTSKCVACRGCQVACKQWWDLEGTVAPHTGEYDAPLDRSPTTWTRIHFAEYEGPEGLQWLFLKEGCLHCGEPACVEVCPTGALQQSAAGTVTLEGERCNGCGYCARFCPFGIPRLAVANRLTGEARATKCNFCQDRTASGLLPACVKTCPAGALEWGEREAMLAKGQARVGHLVSARGFAAANLYGASELGGLGRLYVLTAPPVAYGLPAQPSYPLLASGWQRVVQPIGYVAVGATLLGIAGAFVVARRHVRMEEVE